MSVSTTAPAAYAGTDRQNAPQPAIRTQAPLFGGFLLLLAVATASVFLIIGSRRFSQDVTHTLQVRGTAYKVLNMVQDAETGERGFLLTGNEIYLAPYRTGRDEAPRALDELQALVAGSSAQMATIARLREAMDEKLADLRLTVGLGEAKDFKGALAHVNTNVGNAMMQRVRDAVRELDAEELRRQSSLAAAAETSNRLLGGASLLGILLVCLLAGYVIYWSNRSTRALLEIQGRLHDTNDNLEAIVADRVSELRAANEEIQRFAYIVSHDLRAPLVNVMGFTSELDAVRADITAFLNEVAAKAPQLATGARRMAIETDLPEALAFIRTSTAKMDRLINAILKLSREGRRVMTPQTIDLAELVRAQGESLTQQLEAGQSTLEVQPDLPSIVSDRLAIEQIFGNLIENAIKYLAPGRPGRVAVTGERLGDRVRYKIADNGRGIEAKDFERIFELFRRSGEQNTPGEGIGLAYVRNLARRLGGNVTVQSEFGTGSTFTVSLPAVFTAKAARAK